MKFATALDNNVETFMVYVTTLSTPAMQVYSSCQAQFGLLLADKIPIKVQLK